jgi:hypothetical protein
MSDLLWEMPTTFAKVYYLMVVERLPVFPCLNTPNDPEWDKTPRFKGSFYNASRDPEDIALVRWDQENYLIAVPTGPASGIAILDIDPRNGGNSWYDAHKSKLPETRTHRTGGRGLHLLFRVEDGAIRNTASKIAPGVDVRGDGGYFIFWPAHPERGGAVLDDVPLDQLPPWPDWLVPEEPVGPPALLRTRLVRTTGGTIANRYRIGALLKFMGRSQVGERNNGLFWTACRFAEMRFADPEQRLAAVRKLHDVAVATGLDPDEAERTITSAFMG